MQNTVLGKTGIKIRRIGFGGIPIQRLTFRDSTLVLEKAIDAGINFYDTARAYTDSEEKMGKVLTRYRNSVIIATKSLARSSEKMMEDINISLKNLKTDYIDLYQCHNIFNDDQIEQVFAPGGAMEALKKAKEQGKIKHIGITGHKPDIIIKTIDHFETVQVPVNIVEDGSLKELIPLAKSKGIGTIGMKPMGGGWIKNIKLNLKFILNSGIDVAIPGMDSIQQIDENYSVLHDLTALTSEEMEILLDEKQSLGDCFCRRCEYCMPCPEGLNISFLHVLKNYYMFYNLKEWVLDRLNALDKTYSDCTACGSCIEKCPYSLNTPAIFREAADIIFEKR